MARVDITQDVVVERIAARLRSVLGLGERSVIEVAEAEDVPPLPPGGDWFVTLAGGDGQFETEEQAAGNVTEWQDVTVTIYSRVKLDSTNHDKALTRDERRGLYVLKTKVLASLVGWDATDTDGTTFLRQLIHARSATRPQVLQNPSSGVFLGRLAITFGCPFDWDLL